MLLLRFWGSPLPVFIALLPTAFFVHWLWRRTTGLKRFGPVAIAFFALYGICTAVAFAPGFDEFTANQGLALRQAWAGIAIVVAVAWLWTRPLPGRRRVALGTGIIGSFLLAGWIVHFPALLTLAVLRHAINGKDVNTFDAIVCTDSILNGYHDYVAGLHNPNSTSSHPTPKQAALDDCIQNGSLARRWGAASIRRTRFIGSHQEMGYDTVYTVPPSFIAELSNGDSITLYDEDKHWVVFDASSAIPVDALLCQSNISESIRPRDGEPR